MTVDWRDVLKRYVMAGIWHEGIYFWDDFREPPSPEEQAAIDELQAELDAEYEAGKWSPYLRERA